MQQPELGKQLTALRKEKNLTQEELVEISHVSVRTIQRIEAGEVLPRMSTVKILLTALGESYETFLNPKADPMQTPSPSKFNTSILLLSVIAGAIYLTAEIILHAMDTAWFTRKNDWAPLTNFMYTSLTISMVVANVLFMRGFITLSSVFENVLLRVASYLMIAAVAALGILNISTLWSNNAESLLLMYMPASIICGSLNLIFGISLIRLQDGMGELSRVAGVLEIITGISFISVVLFFIGYVIMVPAVIVEILVLYRGYEYLSKSPVQTTLENLTSN
jgi:transcriptional regulator with XRE-family HTH domain